MSYVCKVIDARTWAVHYVAQVPGDGGKCWGWTDDPERAAKLSAWWRSRFFADAGRCGWRGAQALEVEP